MDPQKRRSISDYFSRLGTQGQQQASSSSVSTTANRAAVHQAEPALGATAGVGKATCSAPVQTPTQKEVPQPEGQDTLAKPIAAAAGTGCSPVAQPIQQVQAGPSAWCCASTSSTSRTATAPCVHGA